MSKQKRPSLDMGKSLSKIAEALVRKNLREPSNWNILFDVSMMLFILGLFSICGHYSLTNQIPLSECLIVAIVFILLCFGWVIYTYSKSGPK